MFTRTGEAKVTAARRAPTAASLALPGGKSRLKVRVAFVLAPQFTLTAFAGFVDALRLAADEGDRSRQVECQWTVLGNPEEVITSSAGVEVRPWEPLQAPERFDYIVIVGGLLHGGPSVPARIYSFLEDAASAGVGLVGLCTGSFILARAGLLAGHAACVSWFHREEFAREFPDIRLSTNQMYLVDGNRMTCAGGTSVVHLAAHLIQRHLGRAYANKSVRILIEDQPLPSNTPQPEPAITRKARDRLVRRAMLLIEQRLSEPDSIPEVLATLGIGMRQLERRFVQDVGMTMREFRLQLRLARARWMVENTDLPLTVVGLECGFGDCAYFSRAFSSRFLVAPSILRRSVSAMRA